jgi:hypothetical protein
LVWQNGIRTEPRGVFVLGLRKLRDIGPGILERDEPAATGSGTGSAKGRRQPLSVVKWCQPFFVRLDFEPFPTTAIVWTWWALTVASSRCCTGGRAHDRRSLLVHWLGRVGLDRDRRDWNARRRRTRSVGCKARPAFGPTLIPAARPPIMRHALAAIEVSIFLCGPIALISPRLKIGLRPLRQEDAPGSEKSARAWSNVAAVPL